MAGLAACSGSGPTLTEPPGSSSAQREDTSTTVVAARPSDLGVGVCVSVPELHAGAVLGHDEVAVSTCDQPHDAEVFAVLPTPADREVAIERCVPDFDAYVGAAYTASSLDVVAVVDDGDAAVPVVCLAHSADFEPLVGSVRGSGR
jgi:hypothetical protein